MLLQCYMQPRETGPQVQPPWVPIIVEGTVPINKIYGLTFSVVLFGSSIGGVAFTYFRILACCGSRKKELNRKALQTCSTNLLLYVIMLWSGFLFIISHRLQIHVRYRMMAFIIFHIVPANMNSIVYALQTKELKTKIVQILHSKITQLQQSEK
ncbi:hypothetical protein SKAU_G00326300 [Synaphobranchus kaupii]|uniref:G-protein coupled receptors family 1 profile domain-containing protein n=1 Tax=Synaphobranchus kaupii TaxID=118154 RepID=A0A9Q1EPR2_SYNKA|nr:hypothetical protein SKAU_G00326300 [Synaphobranchus kaupii]